MYTPKIQDLHRILIVDDEEAFLFGFSRALQSQVIVVDTAQSVETAKTLLQKQRYSVIIADLMLTNSSFMDGIEVIRYAKELQPESRIIVLTAYGADDTRKKVNRLGIDFYFEKPVSPVNIKEIIEHM